eukprot:3661971-Alexandrium_andersonii.AAC.1
MPPVDSFAASASLCQTWRASDAALCRWLFQVLSSSHVSVLQSSRLGGVPGPRSPKACARELVDLAQEPLAVSTVHNPFLGHTGSPALTLRS